MLQNYNFLLKPLCVRLFVIGLGRKMNKNLQFCSQNKIQNKGYIRILIFSIFEL